MTSLTILPTENYNLPFMGHKIPYLSSLLVTCHQSSRLYGVSLQHGNRIKLFFIVTGKSTAVNDIYMITWTTVVPTKSDSDAISCLQMLRTLHLNQRGSIDQWCIIPILRIGLIHK